MTSRPRRLAGTRGEREREEVEEGKKADHSRMERRRRRRRRRGGGVRSPGGRKKRRRRRRKLDVWAVDILEREEEEEEAEVTSL